jgi:hypothetical protein
MKDTIPFRQRKAVATIYASTTLFLMYRKVRKNLEDRTASIMLETNKLVPTDSSSNMIEYSELKRIWRKMEMRRIHRKPCKNTIDL